MRLPTGPRYALLYNVYNAMNGTRNNDTATTLRQRGPRLPVAIAADRGYTANNEAQSTLEHM